MTARCGAGLCCVILGDAVCFNREGGTRWNCRRGELIRNATSTPALLDNDQYIVYNQRRYFDKCGSANKCLNYCKPPPELDFMLLLLLLVLLLSRVMLFDLLRSYMDI